MRGFWFRDLSVGSVQGYIPDTVRPIANPGTECSLQILKGLFRRGTPTELHTLLEQLGYGCNCVTVAPNKTAVEVRKPQEDLDIANGLRCWPLSDGLDFAWIHLDSILVNDVA